MPAINLSSTQIMAIQRLLKRIDRDELDTEDVEIPEEPIGLEEWLEAQVAKKGYGTVEQAHEDGVNISLLEEDYPHDTAMDHVLYQLAEACPICGDIECDDGVAYVGSTPIHASQHPEAKAERAMDNRGGHR